MTRSSLPIAVALAVSAGLLLTGCGGGGSGGSDQIQPSATGTTTAPATTASATEAAGPGAPAFDLPPDITVDFKGFEGSNPTEKAVLTDATYAAKAVIAFEAKTYAHEPAIFKRFWTGLHGAEYADSIISQGKGGSVVTGAFHYYSPVVRSLVAGNVSVQYCEDQRKAYSKDSKTGKVNVTTPSPKDFMSWTLLMTKGANGEWQVFDHKWVEGAKQCQIA